MHACTHAWDARDDRAYHMRVALHGQSHASNVTFISAPLCFPVCISHVCTPTPNLTGFAVLAAALCLAWFSAPRTLHPAYRQYRLVFKSQWRMLTRLRSFWLTLLVMVAENVALTLLAYSLLLRWQVGCSIPCCCIPSFWSWWRRTLHSRCSYSFLIIVPLYTSTTGG